MSWARVHCKRGTSSCNLWDSEFCPRRKLKFVNTSIEPHYFCLLILSVFFPLCWNSLRCHRARFPFSLFYFLQWTVHTVLFISTVHKTLQSFIHLFQALISLMSRNHCSWCTQRPPPCRNYYLNLLNLSPIFNASVLHTTLKSAHDDVFLWPTLRWPRSCASPSPMNHFLGLVWLYGFLWFGFHLISHDFHQHTNDPLWKAYRDSKLQLLATAV